jgi:hypothetical protein
MKRAHNKKDGTNGGGIKNIATQQNWIELNDYTERRKSKYNTAGTAYAYLDY